MRINLNKDKKLESTRSFEYELLSHMDHIFYVHKTDHNMAKFNSMACQWPNQGLWNITKGMKEKKWSQHYLPCQIRICHRNH